MDSKIGLLIQLTGVCVVTVLCLLVSRSLRLTALKYWTIAWLSLSFSLISLQLSFAFESFSLPLLSLYFLGDYAFGLFLIVGCRSLGDGWRFSRRHWFYTLPLLVLAVTLPRLSQDFDKIYTAHAAVMVGLFAPAFLAMRGFAAKGFGGSVVRAALASLMVGYLGYSALSIARFFVVFDGNFLTYNTIVDFVLQMTLGIGMVIVLVEKAISDVRSAGENLEVKNKRLEELAHTDPLTAAFSRHAFHGFVKKRGDDNTETSGCVGFFDIDDLKWINDTHGHKAGDFVIRSVVRAIRDIVRAEDLIFRWGGDEFFVIMISMEAGLANTRMGRLERDLSGLTIDTMPEPFDIGVSFGFTNFNDISGLEEAIGKADAEMYRRKTERKNRRPRGPATMSESLGDPLSA